MPPTPAKKGSKAKSSTTPIVKVIAKNKDKTGKSTPKTGRSTPTTGRSTPISSGLKSSNTTTSTPTTGRSGTSSKSRSTTPVIPSNTRSSTPVSGKTTPTTGKATPGGKDKSASKSNARLTLIELSQNTAKDDPRGREEEEDDMMFPPDPTRGLIQGQLTLRMTPEIYRRLNKEEKDPKEFVASNLDEDTGFLEIVGWSKGKHIPGSFYDNLFTSDIKVKKLALRGRGAWNTCRCPQESDDSGGLIDSISKENITNLEHIYIFRTFNISSCALLDLISRSPNLKSVYFYGVPTLLEHHLIFRSVRFLCSLERIYWPWCNRKLHAPVLKTIVLRNDTISTFYSTCETTCDLISSDLLPNLRYLSMIMNENWACKAGRTKKVKRYVTKLAYLAKATKLEALEVRTFDIDLDEDEGDTVMEETNIEVRNMFEGYQLAFWETVAKFSKLKFLGIYGAWNLDGVARKISEHGLQIEYFRTNLMPTSLIPAVEVREEFLTLSLVDTVNQLLKLPKLKSIHFTCLEILGNIDDATVTALSKLTDLLWRFDTKVCFTSQVEDLLTNILKRGNQKGRSYRISLHIEPEDSKFANLYTDVVERFSLSKTIREKLTEVSRRMCKERTGHSNVRSFHIWGLQQVGGGLDKSSNDQLQTVWNFYDEIFGPIDAFI